MTGTYCAQHWTVGYPIDAQPRLPRKLPPITAASGTLHRTKRSQWTAVRAQRTAKPSADAIAHSSTLSALRRASSCILAFERSLSSCNTFKGMP